jgi:putative addiction module component (TIGR02574 family)
MKWDEQRELTLEERAKQLRGGRAAANHRLDGAVQLVWENGAWHETDLANLRPPRNTDTGSHKPRGLGQITTRAGEPPCDRSNETYAARMALTSVYLAEEALALPPAQREELAKLLLDSLKSDGASDEELSAMLRSRLADLRSGKDAGLSFDAVFGEKA